MPASLSFVIKKELKENKMKTGMLHIIYLLHEANLKDKRLASTPWTIAHVPFLYNTFKAKDCTLFIWVGTSSQIFDARWDSVAKAYVTDVIGLE